MDEQQAPCVLLYHMQSRIYTVISDRSNMLKENSKQIEQQFNWGQKAVDESFHIDLGERRYEVTAVSFQQDSILIHIFPHTRGELYLSFEHEKMLRLQQHHLFELAKSKMISRGAIQSLIEDICETISTVTDSDRVSIWLFDEKNTVLHCQHSFNRLMKDEHFSEWRLNSHDYPMYFEQILNNRFLAVEDIDVDERAWDLKHKDLYQKNKIRSMLDTPIVLSTGIKGVLCCESFSIRNWTELNQAIVGTFVDMISFLFERLQRIELEEEVRDLAYVNQLTGLSNHHAFIELVNEEMEKMQLSEIGYMVYLKLDQFTNIQDVLGHSGGDEVIIQTAKRMKELFNSTGILGHIGFDHFAIFISTTKNDLTTDTIEQMANQLLEPMYVMGQEVYMTHSYGVSVYPDHGKDAKSCLQTAQIALNMGRKRNIRNVKAMFTNDMHTVMADDLNVEMNLRRALDLDEFELYYQPQIDCQSGRVIGFESLIRWNHPERGLMSPADFINLAESTGLIIPIGEWVISQAFQQLEKWNVNKREEFTLSVNISPRHFLDVRLYDFLKQSLEKYNVNPKNLNIEITENVAMEGFNQVQHRMKKLLELGLTVSIDDFGTGFSAFQYLQHFPVQGIKIDRQFIRDIAENEKSMGITKTIIDLGKMMKINIISEGVETVEQWEILRKLGCPQLQGYYFSKPLPLNEVEEWVNQYQHQNK